MERKKHMVKLQKCGKHENRKFKATVLNIKKISGLTSAQALSKATTAD